MSDDPYGKPPERRPETEGVRIIGAEEAQAAIDREDVAQRLPDDAPRFGDRPEGPPAGGPRPALRFPLDEETDPAELGRPAVVPPDPPSTGDVVMPHWSEPPTGEVPRLFAADQDGDDLEAWSSFTSGQPRWMGEGPEDHGNLDDFSRLADEQTRIGALDDTARPAPNDFFADYDDPGYDAGYAEADPYAQAAPTRAITSDPRRTASRPRTTGNYDRPSGPGRNVQQAAGVGIALGVLFLLLAELGPEFLTALVVAVVTVAVVELFSVLRRVGYHPATLLGIVATAFMPIAAYHRGEAAYPLVLFLTVVFGLVWYLVGAGGTDDSPVLGLATTLLGVCYVGVLGSFAALIVVLPDGVGILYGAVLATLGYDLGGFLVGRNLGTRPISEASPNKTVEGLIGGVLGAVFLGAVIAGFIAPWSDIGTGDRLLFGLAAAAAAFVGDLCESVMKRDLGVKDMGAVLPGHGGVLDRFDALLFVLPATYYAARILIF